MGADKDPEIGFVTALFTYLSYFIMIMVSNNAGYSFSHFFITTFIFFSLDTSETFLVLFLV